MNSLPILTRKDVLSQAWPILLSQASIPLVGLVDTAIIGRTGDATELAGVALGASVIGFIFWSFGFLRMGVTGLTAQATGADDKNEVQSILVRSVLSGCIIGAVLTILQFLFLSAAFQILQAGPDVESAATGYASARFWGAPAILASYAINGWLLGLGKSKWALVLQIITNSANILLDLYFVIELDMGAKGVGWGTAIAEWCALIAGLIICAVIISKNGGLIPRILHLTTLLDKSRLKHMFAVNGNIMIRTMALLALMTWFANSGARQGEIQLAANHVLMQMLTVSAFVLDAFAVTAEARVGAAFGAKSKQHFWNAVKLTTEFAFCGALLAAIAIYFGGNTFIDIVVKNQEIVQTAKLFLPMAAAAPLLGVVAWQLDGIFIGTTNTAAMRTSTVITLTIYIMLDIALRPIGNWGVWIAFNASYVLRAITLGAFLPQLIHRIDANK